MINRASIRTLAALAVLITCTSASFADGIRKRVRFPRGSTSTILKGAVIRGDADTYLVGARADQKMTVRITSLENNAVFQIYKPGGKKTLDGAGETDDAMRWTGRLPASGDYVIVVGGTRGNATYRLEIKIE